MSKAKDTLLRNLALLRLIPNRAPGTTTTVLQEKLRDKGFDISLRSLQRDLNKLSIAFAITCDEDQNARRWYYTSDAAINLPSLDTPSALALQLAEKHLGNLLPQGVMAQLARQFNAARNHLDSLDNNTLARWPNKIRALPNGMVLQPAPVQPQVWEQLSQALVEQRQIQVQYLSRSKGDSKALRLHPIGLVARPSISYLIATVDNYQDIRQFALHRIQQAELLDQLSQQPDDWNIDAYIANGAFAQRQSPEQVELIADIHPQTAWLLNETPLSQQQTLKPLPNTEWQRLHAQVPLDQETLWWIFGLNDNIRVHAPQVWVDEIREKIEGMRGMYAA